MTLPVAKPQAGVTGWHPDYWNLVDVVNGIEERIRDVMGGALMPGTGIAIDVNDAGDTITIRNTVTAGSADAEAIVDAVAASLVAGTNITITYNDNAGTITVDGAAIGGGATDPEVVRDTMGTALTAGFKTSIAVDDNANTITVGYSGDRIVAMTDGATITPNADTTDIGTVTLGGNRTIAAPSGTPVNGQKLIFRLRQDGTGSRVPTWNAIYRFAGGTAPILTTAINKTDYLGFIYNSTDSKWDCVAVKLNF